MKLLFDGDHISYRAASSCSPTKLKPYLEPKEAAIARADSMMHQIFQETGIFDFEFYLGGEGNWRKEIYPEYKANRKDIPRPVWLEDVREFLVTTWKAEVVNDKEVDDVCGIRLTEEGSQAICVSLDKDLLTVPGVHYNFVKKVYQSVDKRQALRYFYQQLITGDASDNVPAFDGKLRNKQPMFVEALLIPIQEMYDEVEMYKYCLQVWNNDIEMMHRNAQVLYIQKYEGDKWQPPGRKAENELS